MSLWSLLGFTSLSGLIWVSFPSPYPLRVSFRFHLGAICVSAQAIDMIEHKIIIILFVITRLFWFDSLEIPGDV